MNPRNRGPRRNRAFVREWPLESRQTVCRLTPGFLALCGFRTQEVQTARPTYTRVMRSRDYLFCGTIGMREEIVLPELRAAKEKWECQFCKDRRLRQHQSAGRMAVERLNSKKFGRNCSGIAADSSCCTERTAQFCPATACELKFRRGTVARLRRSGGVSAD